MIICIDIGGTKIRLASFVDSASIIESKEFKTPQKYNEALDQIKKIISELQRSESLQAISIASPGPIDVQNGVILSPTNLSWGNVRIVEDLTNSLNTKVILGHDATLAGIAEARVGAARNVKNVLYITISTGIGISLIINGSPLATNHNLEGGHQIIMLNNGSYTSFENLASGKSITKNFGKAASEISDPAIWQKISYYLAVGIYNLIVSTSPDIVVLGGGVSTHFDKFSKSLNTWLTSFKPLYKLPPVTTAQNIETAPLIGAYLVAKDNNA